MDEVAPEPPHPRWTEADWVEALLFHKKLPAGPRGVIPAALVE